MDNQTVEPMKDFFVNVWNFISAHWEPMVAITSLIISAISLRKSSKAEKLQEKINVLELKLKQYEVETIEKQKEAESVACVEARVIRLGKDKYRLKVWNSGGAPAYNVVASFETEARIAIWNADKQPFDILEPNKSYELSLMVHMQSAHKFKITTEWADVNGVKATKVQMGDL